jgi:uncharacterized membrane protein
MLKRVPFRKEHFDLLEPKEDEETLFHYNTFSKNDMYRQALETGATMFTFFSDDKVIMIVGGYRTTPSTAELILYASRYFDANMIRCIKELRKMMTVDRDEFIPADICRLEINVNMAFPELIKWATKGINFTPVGVRHKFGLARQDDYLLLERVL